MRRIVTAFIVAGAAAAFFEVASARADDGWTGSYDYDAATLVQSPARTQLALAIPATMTNIETQESLRGTDFIRPSEGGPNAEFVTENGAIYAQDKQFRGFPTMYYAPGPNDPPGSAAVIESPFGDINLPSGLAWLIEPADYAHPSTYADALNSAAFTDSGVLGLGPNQGTWTSDYRDMTPVAGADGLPWWSFQNASFTNGDGDTLTGAVYLMSPLTKVGLYDEEFVTKSGAVYDADQWSKTVQNLYYRPGDGGAAVDILKTPLGDLNLSKLSWMFTPPDYSGDVAATPRALVADSDLSSAVDFGQTASPAATAADLPGPTSATAASATLADAGPLVLGPTGNPTPSPYLVDYYTNSYLTAPATGGIEVPAFTGGDDAALALTTPEEFTQLSYLQGDAIVVDVLLKHYTTLSAADPLYLLGYSQSSTILTAVDSHLNDPQWLDYVLTNGGYAGDVTEYTDEIGNLAAIAADLRLVLLGGPAADPGQPIPAGWDNNAATQAILNSESMGYGGGTIHDVAPTSRTPVLPTSATDVATISSGTPGSAGSVLTDGYGMAGQNTNMDLSPTSVYTVADDNWAQVQESSSGPVTASLAHLMYPGMTASEFHLTDHVGNVDYFEATPNIFQDFAIWATAAWTSFWGMF